MRATGNCTSRQLKCVVLYIVSVLCVMARVECGGTMAGRGKHVLLLVQTGGVGGPVIRLADYSIQHLLPDP